MKSFASFLVSAGFQPGDVLQMGCSNNVLFYIPVMAAWMIGGILILNHMDCFSVTLLCLVHYKWFPPKRPIEHIGLKSEKIILMG